MFAKVRDSSNSDHSYTDGEYKEPNNRMPKYQETQSCNNERHRECKYMLALGEFQITLRQY